MPELPDIFPIGDSALTVEFGRVITEQLNARAIKFADRLNKKPFPGMIEAVPAYASATVFYDPVKVRSAFPHFLTACEAVKCIVGKSANDPETSHSTDAEPIAIEVNFGPASAIDLEDLCLTKNVTRDEFINIFTARSYRVYMIGFLPGFAYMGEVDDRIAFPRHSKPRLSVPKGSVGIAGTQTGIYSLESPGGWQIIGQTNFELLRFDTEPPCTLQPGNTVKFVDAARHP